MNVAKWLLLALLTLPLMELVAFVVVAQAIGFARALLLVVATSVAGALVLRKAGGNHIARMRVALNQSSFTALQADSSGALLLLAGFLLLIPGFITDAIGLLLLVGALARSLFGAARPAPAPRADGVVDLDPEQWRRVPDPVLPDRRDNDEKR